jgi:chromosome segregation ATPase
MSEAQTNPKGEVNQPQLSMFDVMFGSEETTNPEQAIEEPTSNDTEEYEAETFDEAEEEILEEVEEYEEADEEAPAETPQAYTVKVDGEEYEVTLDELRDGYQRQADYTRKSQSLAEQRKAYEANLQAVQNERNQYAQVLQQMSENENYALKQFEDINWKELKDEDPMEYMEKRLEYQEAKDRVTQINSERARVHHQNEQEFTQVMSQKVREEAELLSKALPEYSAPGSTLKTDLRNYALSLGFPENEVDAISDHKVVLVLHKAMMQDSATKGVKKVKTAPKVVKSGTPQTKSQRVKRVTQAKRERLAKTGHAKDAADVFLDLIT